MLFAERLKFILSLFLGFFLLPFLVARMLVRRFRLDSRPRRILIVPIITRVGDLVCSTPVFLEIKRTYPDAYLVVVASKKNIGIIRHNPRIDEIININDVPFKGYLGRLRFFWRIGMANFDWVISLTNNPFNNVVALWSSAPYRVKMAAEDRSFMERVTDRINNYLFVYKNHTFLPGFYLRLLEPLGIHQSQVHKEVFTSIQGETRVSDWWRERGLEGRCVVGISITAGNKIKEWGDEQFAELARRLSAAFATPIVFIGAPHDRPRIDAVVSSLKGQGDFFSATEFSLEELPSVVKRLSLFVAVDTGTIYIAHALGVPLVDIIGPVDPREQPPADAKSIQVLPAGVHVPSSFTIKAPGPSEAHMRSLRATSVESVFVAASKLLGS